jgi:hypothetical protein
VIEILSAEACLFLLFTSQPLDRFGAVRTALLSSRLMKPLTTNFEMETQPLSPTLPIFNNLNEGK